jgi:hypothetical protein
VGFTALGIGGIVALAVASNGNSWQDRAGPSEALRRIKVGSYMTAAAAAGIGAAALGAEGLGAAGAGGASHVLMEVAASTGFIGAASQLFSRVLGIGAPKNAAALGE